jgi:thiamine transport system substrate-binding protein
MEAFLNSDLTLIYQDPRVSTPGLGFVTWLNLLYPDKMADVWDKIKQKTVAVTSGWSEAYGLFLKGEADAVLSYTSSPLYHMLYEDKDNYQAMIFDEGHYLQIEFAAITKASTHKQLARDFVQFLLTPTAQEIIAYKNMMYPVLQLEEIDNITQNKVKFNQLPTPQQLSSTVSKQQVDKWIELWQENILK